MEKEKDGLPITTVREIKLLSRLSHPNLICLEEVAVGPVSNQFFLVFEYAAHDLTDILDSDQFVPGKSFSLAQTKTLLFQLLSVLDYLHSHWVIHRDIKVSNMLYFDDIGVMKLADFGLARSFANFDSEPLTPETVTLWYRSPEILFGSSKYGPSADLWSVGCVFGELILGKPLFPGDSVMDQANRITNMLGSFHATWPEINKLQPYVKSAKHNPQLEQRGRKVFIDTFKHTLGEHGLDLLERLLTFDPVQRITAAAALDHPFFNQDPLPASSVDMPSFEHIRRKPPKEFAGSSSSSGP
jgi:serine/threonine protein kinase